MRDALRMLRSEIGMTQTEFASAVFVSFSTVNRWENKGMRPNRMQSKAILDLAKRNHVSAVCLERLSCCLLASRVNDKEDKERLFQVTQQIKLEQNNLLTAEQFRKTLDNIDMALIGQRFYQKNPESCDCFYHNSSFAKTLGYTAMEFDEKLRKNTFFAIAPDYRQRLLEQLRKLLCYETDVCDFCETVKVIHRDGAVLWLEIKAASLTEYSYGQEVFTFCRDITRRVVAEQRYKEEVLIRDASMQVMFSNIHCDLTENRISRHYNLASTIGRDYNGESFDELIEIIADAAPNDKERESFIDTFSREALIKAYSKGRVYGNIVLYNKNARRWFRNEYLTVKNPVSNNIHALIYIFDIQKQVLSESMIGVFFERFFDFVGIIDIETETIEPYFYAEGVFKEQYTGCLRHYPTVCAERLAQYGSNEESEAISLETIRVRLEEKSSYSTILHFNGCDGTVLKKKVTYTYLDSSRNTVIMTQSNPNRLECFL